MRSVGEVMAIGRCFEEALQKAVRMLDTGKIGLVCNPEDSEPETEERIRDVIANPTDERLYMIPKALKMGIPIMETLPIKRRRPILPKQNPKHC